jgi:ABC-type phosphate transport system substrate-binding protein
MYTAGEPAGAVKEFLDFVTGDGQGLVAGLGFVPLQRKNP